MENDSNVKEKYKDRYKFHVTTRMLDRRPGRNKTTGKGHGSSKESIEGFDSMPVRLKRSDNPLAYIQRFDSEQFADIVCSAYLANDATAHLEKRGIPTWKLENSSNKAFEEELNEVKSKVQKVKEIQQKKFTLL